MVEFPKPIPALNVNEVYDEVGISATEKAAVQNCWRVIKRRFRYHSFKIFLEFSTENESLLERYRGPNGKFVLHALNNHPLYVMNVMGELIENGLDNSRLTNVLLSTVVERHTQSNVHKLELKMMSDAVQDYILDYLKPICSPTLRSGLKKVCDQIYNHFEWVERHTVFSLKKSVDLRPEEELDAA